MAKSIKKIKKKQKDFQKNEKNSSEELPNEKIPEGIPDIDFKKLLGCG